MRSDLVIVRPGPGDKVIPRPVAGITVENPRDDVIVRCWAHNNVIARFLTKSDITDFLIAYSFTFQTRCLNLNNGYPCAHCILFSG